MQVVGQSINQRATNYYPDSHPDPLYGRYYEGFTETKNVNSPWLARAAVRENKLHGVDYIKIYTTQDFVGPVHMWRPDATLVNSPSLTLEEVEAVVDEAHRLGLKVACHTYGGEGMRSCLTAGVDAPNHLLELDDAGVQVLLQKKLPFVPTIDDLIALEKPDLRDTGGRNSRLKLLEQAVRRAVAAGVPIVFGSGATSRDNPAWQAGQPVRVLRQLGDGPGGALQTAYLPAARMLNYDWDGQIGSIETGQVRRHHRGFRKPDDERHRDGTRQIRDEGRPRRARRSEPAPGVGKRGEVSRLTRLPSGRGIRTSRVRQVRG